MDDVIDFSALSILPVPTAPVAAASGTSASLFSTPLSTSSGSTGGDRFGSSVGLFYCRDDTDVCRGVIVNSGGNRFCIKSTCEVKAHRAQKVIISAGNLYILGTRKDQSLLEPSLEGDLLSKDHDIEEIIEAVKPVNVWKAFFESQSNRKENPGGSDAPSDDSWEDLESPTLEKLSAVTSSYVTPKKLKVGFLLEAFADSIPIGLSKTTKLSKLPDNSEMQKGDKEKAGVGALKVVMTEWNILRSNFELIDDEFAKLGEGEKKYRDAISETVFKIHDAIRDTDARTSLLTAQLGKDNSDASGQGTDSIWDSIRRVYETMLEVQDDILHITSKSTEVTEIKEHVLTKMDTLAQNFHGLNNFTQESISKISQKIRALEAKRSPTVGVSGSVEYRRLLDRIGIVDDIVERNTRDITRGDKALAKIDSEINTLKRKFSRIDSDHDVTSDLSDGGAGLTTLDERIRTLEDRALQLGTDTNDDVDDLGCKVVALSDRLDKAEAKGSDECFTMEDFAFGSYGDFAAFMLEHKVPTCGMF
jgi:predicted  nucleic acid-binding Zn-ribbon protein